MHGNGKMIWLLAWLLLWAAWDLRYRVICLWQGLLVLATGVVWQWWQGQLFTGTTGGGILLGMAAWGFSLLSKEQLGKGDAMVILCLGLYLGFSWSLSVLLWGLLAASAVSLWLICFKKRSSRETIPFIPFLTVGYVLVWGGEILGGLG